MYRNVVDIHWESTQTRHQSDFQEGPGHRLSKTKPKMEITVKVKGN